MGPCDKPPVIAAALGCTVAAVDVARDRFGLNPRRMVSGRPKEPDEPAHRIERGRLPDLAAMEFCSEKELVAQTGHQSHDWPRVITKELVDNGLDAARRPNSRRSLRSRSRPAKSGHGVTSRPTRIVIADNGLGIPPAKRSPESSTTT